LIILHFCSLKITLPLSIKPLIQNRAFGQWGKIAKIEEEIVHNWTRKHKRKKNESRNKSFCFRVILDSSDHLAHREVQERKVMRESVVTLDHLDQRETA
jgi:hypothetical protein